MHPPPLTPFFFTAIKHKQNISILLQLILEQGGLGKICDQWGERGHVFRLDSN